MASAMNLRRQPPPRVMVACPGQTGAHCNPQETSQLESSMHRLRDLFGQLGLPGDPASIEAFIAALRPPPAGVAFAESSFWAPSQVQFLREENAEDADWAEAVGALGSLFST